MMDLATAIPALRRAMTPAAEAQAMARFARDPSLNRQMQAFARAVERAPDLNAALRDPRVLGVLLPALGLPEGVNQAGLAARALVADPKDPQGLLARLPDRRWKSVAETLNLAERGLEGLRDPKLHATLADGLRRMAWRQELDQRHPGIADAMAFQERAGTVRGPYDVLGDPVLRRVVTGALGLPPQLALQSVEAQARTLNGRFDVAKLQDPRQAARMAERYLLAAGASASPWGGGAAVLPGFPAGGLLA
ncbi:DUF1217 domain-containing protein [Crenalkalicoccus roseus]|uniref:DUF1217 domain-containing protein n=1 Tax=Crenalkalicoccus roseus TaxID=1485588 RepID=UPI001081B721|nr:DUF1217 domain-containing protein [Crenalkalicoccus roseus]